VVGLAAATSSWLAYQGVHGALQSEFERRLERLAAAQQIAPREIAEMERQHDDANAYLAIQTQLQTLRFATGVENASLIDTTGYTLVDLRSQAPEYAPTALDSVARGARLEATRGRPAVSAPYERDGRTLRAGFAPVRDGGRTVAVVAIEAEAAYIPVLATLGRALAGLTLATLLAIGLLATLVLRAARGATELERRLARAENLAAMGRLTATLAHEIKNPLAIIRGSADRLGRVDPEAKRMADFVVEESDRLSRTVARYLQFARVAAEPGSEALETTGDAVRALEATLDLLEGELRARGVHLEREGVFPAEAPVALDNESLKQLYLNLMLNAIEAMAKGGTLQVWAGDRGGRFEVSLADSGPGMAPEVLRRIGSPFFSTKATGSGLGLFLARRLARSAGGDLRVTSEPGRGTTCVVRLPRRGGQRG